MKTHDFNRQVKTFMPYLGIHAVGHQISRILVRGLQLCQNLLGNLFVIPVSTFDDPTLQNITARALLTDGQKINSLSDPIEASLGLGELRTEGISDLK